ncbi:hypothetical protein GCM10009682_27900 [Luedemannella flava]|uniref:Uncharacterized protein n=1 Tax=Luedemannella flava TaxID=349316 RepID=A0ABP4YBY2_9ACTN
MSPSGIVPVDPAELCGAWSRSLLVLPDGSRDDTTSVTWLQGRSYYVDLRQPAGRPNFADPPDGAVPEAGWLAGQQGFAGRLDHDGTWFTWEHLIDLAVGPQPADAGALAWAGDILVETGRDEPYREHWHRTCPADPVEAAAARLRDVRTGRDAVLVRVRDQFGYAHGRSPAARAAGRFDAEIALGVVTATAWRIERSSLPWRQGQLLAIAHDWAVVDVEGDAQLLRGKGLTYA